MSDNALTDAQARPFGINNVFQRYAVRHALENWVEEREEYHRERRITAEKFLGLLDRNVEGFTFQTFDDTGGKSKGLVRVLNGTLAQHWDALWQRNSQGAGIYVTINRTDGKGRTAENIVGVRALFVDLDGSPLEPVLQYKLPPHFVVESSPGKYHAYWRVDDVALDQFKPLQMALAARFGGDPKVSDLPRVLRLPGFYHKKAEPFLTHIVSTHDGPAYEVADFDFPPEAANDKKVNGGKNPFQEYGEQQYGQPSIEEVRAALVIQNHADVDRDRWIEIGLAVYAATDGSEEGFAAFDEWSQEWEGVSEKGEGYNADETRRVWESLQPREITAGTLFHYANEADPCWRDQIVDEPIDARQPEEQQPEERQNKKESARQAREAVADIKRQDMPPRPTENDVGMSIHDFRAFMPMPDKFIYGPTREMWPGSSVDARVRPIFIGRTESGEKVYIPASQWLKRHRPVEQMTWAPGEPLLIEHRLITEGGFIERRDVTVFNLYRPPNIVRGDASKAGPWLDHVRKIYPEDADHIIKWCAQRVQHPEVKINHALVLGGAPGIGKDTMLEPVKRAVGPWNCNEVAPSTVMERFNDFLKSVILRISEAHDLGEVSRYSLYERTKAYTASPPDVLRVDQKFVNGHHVLNCVGIVYTTNHKDSLYLPPDDRRHYVAWSELTKASFEDGYWNQLWGWYDNGGGDRHVAAYLAELDLSSFDPKAPPPKTAAFWFAVDANRAPEGSELADILDKMGRPTAVTVAQIAEKASYDFEKWLEDRKNRRAIPHRLAECGYVAVRNDIDTRDGQWRIGGKRQVVYAHESLSPRDRFKAVATLKEIEDAKEAEAAAKRG
jgi:hypothetical protein